LGGLQMPETSEIHYVNVYDAVFVDDAVSSLSGRSDVVVDKNAFSHQMDIFMQLGMVRMRRLLMIMMF
jgi:hypothetical protein